MDERRFIGTGDELRAAPTFEVDVYRNPARHVTRNRIFYSLATLFLLGFVWIQIIPVVPAGHVNKAVVREPNWDSLQTRELTMRACGDCHSNHTEWPWFSYVAPASWVISNHVWKARNGMNFHNWDYTAGTPRSAEQVEESIREGRMPPRAYLLTHPEARLTPEETEALIRGLVATLTADPHAAAMFQDTEGE